MIRFPAAKQGELFITGVHPRDWREAKPALADAGVNLAAYCGHAGYVAGVRDSMRFGGFRLRRWDEAVDNLYDQLEITHQQLGSIGIEGYMLRDTAAAFPNPDYQAPRKDHRRSKIVRFDGTEPFIPIGRYELKTNRWPLGTSFRSVAELAVVISFAPVEFS